MSFVGYNGFGGRTGTANTYVKLYNPSLSQNLAFWIYMNNGNVIKTITPNSVNQNGSKTNVYINGDLTVTGAIINPSDIRLKENIKEIEKDELDNLLNLEPKKYNLINDKKKNYIMV